MAWAVVLLIAGAAGGSCVEHAQAEPLKQLSSFGPDGSEAFNFERVGAIAADEQNGVVYVLDSMAGTLYKFDLAGQPLDFGGSNPSISGNRITGLDPFEPGGFQAVSQVAVSPVTHDVYVTEKHSIRAFHSDGEPAEFSAGPGVGTNEIPGFSELYGVAVDLNGNIYASDHAGTVTIFAASGETITGFTANQPHNITVAPNGAVYVLEQQEAIERFAPDSLVSSSTTYTGAVVIERSIGALILGLAIDPMFGDVYVLESNLSKTWIRRYDASGTFLESIGEPGTSDELSALGRISEGIAVLGSGFEVQEKEVIKFYSGDSSGDNESKVAVFGTRTVVDRPSVESLRVTDVTADSAVLRGSINPNTKATRYQFEYGLHACTTGACTSVPFGGAAIGSGFEAVPVSSTVDGLTPGTIYFYRLLAENELGQAEETGTFRTQNPGASFMLSDSRAWEMVSPPNKRAARLMGASQGLIQASEDGNGISYLSRGSIEEGPDGNRSLEVSSVLSKRNEDGWSSKDITPANSRTVPLAVGSQSEFKVFDPSLSKAALTPRDGRQLSPQTSERTPYLWYNAEPPLYVPLVTSKEGYANVPPGLHFGGDPLASIGPVSFVGANRKLADIVLNSEVPLVAGAPEAPSPALYHWRAGELHVVSELPESEGGKIVRGTLGSGPGSTRHAVSEDGTRIFWGRGSYDISGNGLSALFLHDTELEESVRLDTVHSGAGGGEPKPVFQGANLDGTVVLFKTSQQLTSGASTSGSDLYRCEISQIDPSLGCASLTNITAVAGAESAEVIGLVSGVSDDGNAAFFAARGVLGSVPNQFGDGAVAGEPNLYYWRRDKGIRFVATLSEQDSPTWGGVVGLTSGLSASLSPNGRYFAFMSQRSLTGQSNLDNDSGQPAEGVYMYDSETEEMVCVSCSPSGEAPVGAISAGFAQLIDPQRQWEGQRVAATLPQAVTLSDAGVSAYQPRAILNNGRLYFNSLGPLVPADGNNQWDVYQYEPSSIGGCDKAISGSSAALLGSGCISLISSGTGNEEAVFLDASVSGDDVFFLTPARLSPLDQDLELDVYDARVHGRPASLSPVPGCVGDACRSNPGLQEMLSPASSRFMGSGNVKKKKKCLKAKRRAKKASRKRCITRKHHRDKKAGKGGGRNG